MAQLLGTIYSTSQGLGDKTFVTHQVSSGSQIDAHLRKRPIYVHRHTVHHNINTVRDWLLSNEDFTHIPQYFFISSVAAIT